MRFADFSSFYQEKFLNNSLVYLGIILFCMLLVPFSEFFSEAIYGIPFIFERALLTFVGLAGLAVFAFNFWVQKKLTFIDGVYLVLVLLASFSVVYSQSKNYLPLFIPEGHIEELSHYFAYFFLFYCATKIDIKKFGKYIFFALLMVGLLHNFLGVLQLNGIRLAVSYNYEEMHERLRCIYGLTSNFNFYAGLATIFTALVYSLYLFSNKVKSYDWKFIILIFLMPFCAICSATRLGILGVGTSIFLAFVITFVVTLRRKFNFLSRNHLLTSLESITLQDCNVRFLNIFIALILSGFFVYFCFPQLLEPSLGEFIIDFKSISNNHLDDVGSFRGLVWRFAAEYLVNGNFITGTGIGYFSDVFFTNPNLKDSPQIVNFAHNEYLHIFATQGIVAFIVYIALFTLSLFRCVRSISRSTCIDFIKSKSIVLFVLLAYMCQAFFNCNIFEVYFYFWILLGLAYLYEK